MARRPDPKSRLLFGATLVGSALGLLLLLTVPTSSGAPLHRAACSVEGDGQLAWARPAGAALLGRGDATQERRAPSAPVAWLRVFDRESLAPLEPSELSLTPAGADAPERLDFAVERARAPLRPEQLVRGELRVRVPGYVPLAGTLDLAEGENRVLLERAGSLCVRLGDGAGEPVAGVEIELLPPLADGRDWHGGAATFDAAPRAAGSRALVPTAEGWMRGEEPVPLDNGTCAPASFEELLHANARRTDASGCAVWSGLPARAGYRWGVALPVHVGVAPPHEQRRLVELGDELRTGVPPPAGVSGRFEIVVGERLELEGVVLPGASVRGRVACAAAVSSARVTLYRVRSAGGNTARRAVSFDAEQSQRAGADGEFLFTDIRPATWLVRAWWEEEGRELFFACQTFRLQPAAELDLGVLHRLRGESLDVSLGIVDQDGHPLEPGDVYTDDERRLFANLSLTATPASGDAAHMVSGFLALPFGETFRVNGLQAGRAHASVQPGHGLRLDASWVSGIEGAQPAGFEVGGTDVLELALVARVGVSRGLVLRDPSGVRLAAPSVWVHHVESGAVSLAPLREGEGEEAAQELNLPPGTYDLWCKLTTGDAPAGLAGGARVDLEAGRREPIEVAVRAAASISGVLRDPSGAPLPGRTLTWTCGPWPLGEPALYSATTDPDGAFELRAIPPGTALRGAQPGTDLPAVGPGQHEGVELVLTP